MKNKTQLGRSWMLAELALVSGLVIGAVPETGAQNDNWVPPDAMRNINEKVRGFQQQPQRQPSDAPQGGSTQELLQRLDPEYWDHLDGKALKFYQSQCAVMDGEEKLKCMEHVFAMNIPTVFNGNLCSSQLYKNSEDTTLALTDKGREFLQSMVEKKPYQLQCAQEAARPSEAGDDDPAVAGCLNKLSGKERYMKQRSLAILKISCGGDKLCLKKVQSKWLEKNCSAP